MKKSRVLMIIWGYLGAVIGAGFASGQEIVQFFVKCGPGGIWGVILAGFLFALYGGTLLLWASKNGVKNYQSVLRELFGANVSRVIDTALTIFLFLGICTMFSASGAVFYEHLYLSKQLGIVAAYIGVLLLLIKGQKSLFSSYNLLVPIKILLLLLVAGYAAFSKDTVSTGSLAAPDLWMTGNGHWMVASVLYVAYNFTLALVVLAEYAGTARSSEGLTGGFIGGALLGLVALICYLALSRYLPDVLNYEVPMLFIAGRMGLFTKVVYLLVLWLGILTTALANTYGFAQRLAELTGLRFSWSLFLTVTLALPLAFQSFSFLVATVYPVFGILGVFILGALLYRFLKVGFNT
ncbi:MAG: hypothetical protein ACM3PP_05245 [Candidatus Saccharibacteria bacterium]